MTPLLNSILIYAGDMQRTARFYQTYFGFVGSGETVEGLITLTSVGGASIVIHQAARGVKLGQAGVKLVFDVQDVEAFKQKSELLGLKFGATHQANGYVFANTKDPDKNSVAISSRAFRS